MYIYIYICGGGGGVGVLLGGPKNKDYSIFGSILGSAIWGNYHIYIYIHTYIHMYVCMYVYMYTLLQEGSEVVAQMYHHHRPRPPPRRTTATASRRWPFRISTCQKKGLGFRIEGLGFGLGSRVGNFQESKQNNPHVWETPGFPILICHC